MFLSLEEMFYSLCLCKYLLLAVDNVICFLLLSNKALRYITTVLVTFAGPPNVCDE